MNAKLAGLTAINEALTALDYDYVGEHLADDLVAEAMDLLMDARALLTTKPWPERALRSAAELEEWVTAHAEEQRRDGRQ